MSNLQAPSKADSKTGLPTCPYRSNESASRFSCAAAEGASVTGEDCKACPIPDALLHEHACLYLVPLRQANEGRFACRWFFSYANDPAPKSWRNLCFCRYWFPRPPLDQENKIRGLTEVRSRYLRVLCGEAPRSKPLPLPDWRAHSGTPPPRRLRGWLHNHFRIFR